MNIVIPIAGVSTFFNSETYPYPKPLIEIDGIPIIQHVVKNISSIKDRDVKFIFLVRNEDCTTHHIDDTLKVLTNQNCQVIKVDKQTRGAACTCLLAIDSINNDEELILCNGDQLIDHDLNKAIDAFRNKNADAGVICFESIHPKWSYIRTDEHNEVVELAEKRPISNKAIAGFYYFKKGSDFVSAAFQSIKKDAHVNGSYFIAPCMNELVLEGKKILHYDLEHNQYHSFYSPQKIQEYLDLRQK